MTNEDYTDEEIERKENKCTLVWKGRGSNER